MRRAAVAAVVLLTAACSSNSPANSAPGAASTVNLIADTVVPTTTSPQDSLVACLATWPLRDRIALLVWPGAYSNQWTLVEQTVRDLHVGGVLLMQADETFVFELAVHLDALKQLSPHGLLIATDEEGGDVQRLRALEALPSQADMSQMEIAERTLLLDRHAQVVAAAGIDVVLGPIVDVRPLVGSDPLGAGRLFVGDPQQVTTLGAEYVGAWQRAGMLPVLKHFPGHGSATADTHDELATTPMLDEMRSYDLLPFEQLAASGAAVMVGHLNVPGLTDGQPASMSAAAISLLRDLGYADALVLSDALGMDAIGVAVADAAVLSVQAGVDVVIFTGIADTLAVIDAIELAVNDGRLTIANIDDSALRVARLLEADARPCVSL
jgi:beta-N-acetylhexosaminidase